MFDDARQKLPIEMQKSTKEVMRELHISEYFLF